MRPVYPALTAAMRVCRRAAPARLRARLRQWMFQWLDLRWDTRAGVRLRVDGYGQWAVYNEIFVNGDYDHAVALALDAPREAGVPLSIVDLGAHVGYFTLRAVDGLLARGIGLDAARITAVEANPAWVRDFQDRVLGDNGLGASVRLVHGLVGERSGHGVLDGDRLREGAPARTGAVVPYVDLSALLAPAARIDLLKCDVEGSEQRLLEHYPDVLGKTRVATFELHRPWCDTERCRALLREYGFIHAATLRAGEPFSILTVWR
jgi:FkbM family methyltransferase